MKQGYIFLIYLFVSAFMSYISWSIITKKPIPLYFGFVIGVTAVALVIENSYYYYEHLQSKSSSAAHGLSFNPKDPKYDPIGGIGGVGFI
jgi:hypothetical protein